MPKKRCAKRDPVCQPLDQEYRFIPLTHQKIAIVDAADFEWLSEWNWMAVARRKIWYAVATTVDHTYMHRLIFGGTCDHRNHNGLDNRRSNLRKATQRQNCWNKCTKRTQAKPYKGIWAHYRKWKARISPNGKHINLGSFSTPIEAAKAYDEAAIKHFGEFASLNFPAKD